MSNQDKDTISFVEGLKRQWMATVDALADPLLLVDPSTFSIRKANLAAAKFAGVDVRRLINQKCYEVFAGRSEPCVGCKMTASANTKSAQYFEISAMRDERFVEVNSQPIFEANGLTAGVVQVYRDRTEAKQMREQLIQSEKLSSLGMLAGGVAHEINNPLGGVLVFGQMLQRELPEGSRFREDVDEIVNAAQRCKQIVESLLDFARNKTSTKYTESFSVSEALESALKFSLVAVSKNLHVVKKSFQYPNHSFVGDRNRVIQLFLNLIQNALQAMPSGGELCISNKLVERNGRKSVCYTVSDTGAGIPQDIQAKIFDPFFTTKEPGQGTGLGLSICHSIVEELNGEIEFVSIPNRGTQFFVYLPVS